VISPNKSLGQHFLVNEGVIARIAERVDSLSEKSRAVLEIGPGPGALTRALLASGLKVLAIELDSRMIVSLKENFAKELGAGDFKVIEADALTVNLGEEMAAFSKSSWVACGNLPYNVGTPILFRLLEEAPEADRFCFMLQKEVVLRLISKGGAKDYGIPSVKMAWSVDDLGHFWVKPGSFNPPPKVDSAVFAFRRKALPLANPLERGGLYDKAGDFVAQFFRQRRKMMRGTLASLTETRWGAKRPEEISPEDFLSLYKNYV